MNRCHQRLLFASWFVAYTFATTVLPLVHNAWHDEAHGLGRRGHARAHAPHHGDRHAEAHRRGVAHRHAHAHRSHAKEKRRGLPEDRGSLPGDPAHGAGAPEHFGLATLAGPPPAALALVERRMAVVLPLPSAQCAARGPARSSARPRAPPHA